MAKYILTTLLIFVLSSYAILGSTQEYNTKNTLKLVSVKNQQKAKIEDLSWFSGNWIGAGMGNYSQEVWAKPNAHSMMGMFQMIKDNKVIFYELIHIVESQGGLLMQLKHFNADLKGWEEKDDTVKFELIKIEGQKAWFNGMTYQRKGDELKVWVAMKQKDGTFEEAEFLFKLVENS